MPRRMALHPDSRPDRQSMSMHAITAFTGPVESADARSLLVEPVPPPRGGDSADESGFNRVAGGDHAVAR